MNGDVFFEIVCPVNFEDSMKFQMFTLRKNSGTFFLFYAAVAVMSLLINLKDIKDGTAYVIMAAVFSLLLFPLIFYVSIRISLKKTLDSPVMRDNVNRYLFYQDGFENIDNQSKSAIFYGQITEAYETDEFFYLYIEKNRAYIVGKYGFTFNTPAEMRKLLQIKLGERFVVKSKI